MKYLSDPDFIQQSGVKNKLILLKGVDGRSQKVDCDPKGIPNHGGDMSSDLRIREALDNGINL